MKKNSIGVLVYYIKILIIYLIEKTVIMYIPTQNFHKLFPFYYMTN